MNVAVRRVGKVRLWPSVLLCVSAVSLLVPGHVGAQIETEEISLPEMLVIPEGSFTMGGKLANEQPLREVSIKSFLLARTEVTFAQWDTFERAIGSHRPFDEGWGRGDHPVVNVNWHDVQEYIAWLNEQTGESYRLPTEAEWEYAARAGSTTDYPWGDKIDSGMANCWGCGSAWDHRGTAPVASLPANAWGLHDMQGNVWEWLQDCYVDSYTEAPVDGSAVSAGDCENRALRGGSWYDLPLFLRSAFRFSYESTHRSGHRGFRLALDL